MMIHLPRNPRIIKLYISWINRGGDVSMYMLEALSVNGGKKLIVSRNPQELSLPSFQCKILSYQKRREKWLCNG